MVKMTSKQKVIFLQQAHTERKKIDEFFSLKVKTLEETIARMTAKDGLKFYVFTTSEDLRRCLKADGFSPIPTSPKNTIRRVMVSYSKKSSRKIKG